LAISQPSARPSSMQSSIAARFGTGSAPGNARQTGQVFAFGGAAYSIAQRQNIFVRVFRCTWISRPMTGSHSATELLLRLEQGVLDRAAHGDHPEPVLEHAVSLDQPQLALAGLELELHVADEHGARAVEHARPLAEDALGCRHEVRRLVGEPPHASLVGTGSNPSACSSACAARKSAFSENCGPISCSPTGSPSESPHGIERLGSPAMFEGIV